MKKIVVFILLLATGIGQVAAQARINKKQVELLEKNLRNNPLLSETDEDFKGNIATGQWANESAVVLCQKTSFDFDKKGISVGKRIGRNIWGILAAPLTMGYSIYSANANNEVKILVEETERRKIALKDKFAVEQYSVLYFRLSAEGDAFAARVIKKEGSPQPVDIAEAVRVDDIKSVPPVFRSYTDERFTSTYRPAYFKIAVPGLEEGDIIEYEFKNFNTQEYLSNPNYKEFDPVYYLCNRDMPVARQIIEVATQDDKYYIGYKSLKGAPDFVQSTDKGKKVYRWVDNNREKISDTRYVSEFMELPSVKFQVIYARNNSKRFIWFNSEGDMKKDISLDELGVKAKTFWYNPEKLQTTGDYNAGLRTNVEYTVREIYKSLKKKGVANGIEEDYVRKAYYHIRSQTMYRNWSDYAFARVFSSLLEMKKIDHEIVVTAPNNRTNLNTVAFTQEITWLIKYKNKFYVNPGEHANPEELPASMTGNTVIRFHYKNEKAVIANEVLPLSDSLDNAMLTQVNATLNGANMSIEKSVETKGLMKNDMVDDVLALTPFMESDFRNYDGMSMWDGMDSRQEEKALTDFNEQKKEWKEAKPEMMKAQAETEYGYTVEKYNTFRLQQDGRSFKKKNLKYSESFVLADMTAAAGSDMVVALPALIGRQPKIKKEERTRTLPVDVRYPCAMSWKVAFTIPAGYTVKGLESLNQTVDNECGSFLSTAIVEGNTILLQVRKMYKGRRFDAAQWPKLLAMLDAGYAFSQAKIVLKKQ